MQYRRRSTILGILLGLGTLSAAAASTSRPAGDLTVVEPSGKHISVADYQGKVVLIQFLYTTCPHCQAAARMYNKLQHELGSKGLQVIGVAFNQKAEGHPEEVRRFIDSDGLDFLIGTAPRDTVIGYLGISVLSRFMVPQIMIIDRNGMIRAQSVPLGSPELQTEAHVRAMLENLLAEKKTHNVSSSAIARRHSR